MQLYPKIIITYSSNETPHKNSENSSANDDMNMNIVPNKNTIRGLSIGSNPNLLSAAVMEKISRKYYKTTCAILKTIKNLKILANFNHQFHFFPSSFQLVTRLLRMGILLS